MRTAVPEGLGQMILTLLQVSFCFCSLVCVRNTLRARDYDEAYVWFLLVAFFTCLNFAAYFAK